MFYAQYAHSTPLGLEGEPPEGLPENPEEGSVHEAENGNKYEWIEGEDGEKGFWIETQDDVQVMEEVEVTAKRTIDHRVEGMFGWIGRPVDEGAEPLDMESGYENQPEQSKRKNRNSSGSKSSASKKIYGPNDVISVTGSQNLNDVFVDSQGPVSRVGFEANAGYTVFREGESFSARAESGGTVNDLPRGSASHEIIYDRSSTDYAGTVNLTANFDFKRSVNLSDVKTFDRSKLSISYRLVHFTFYETSHGESGLKIGFGPSFSLSSNVFGGVSYTVESVEVK